jgi:hypothetical protein
MERSHLYLMFAAKLLGEPVEDDLIDLTGCDTHPRANWGTTLGTGFGAESRICRQMPMALG